MNKYGEFKGPLFGAALFLWTGSLVYTILIQTGGYTICNRSRSCRRARITAVLT